MSEKILPDGCFSVVAEYGCAGTALTIGMAIILGAVALGNSAEERAARTRATQTAGPAATATADAFYLRRARATLEAEGTANPHP